MKLIIDIDEDTYKCIKKCDYCDHICYIADGTPLPKGHGRLIDISQIDKDRIESNNPIIYLTLNGEYIEAISLDYLNDLPTIIEADKEG